jgi:Tol biopolymer transport system component
VPLTPGSKLGHYEIVAPLGAGGMGEVYRAHDPRLGREVALKILPAAFASDPARQARFEQEARAAAALNHPNIVGVYDIGSAEGVFYIVSELVPGETLEAMIARGPIPIKKLLDIAVQTADGMSAAHGARITHRDLKPANLMVAEDGRVKILDFGLARQAPAPSASPEATATIHQTSAGMIVGTVNYMSPEQARGKEVDYRSDQFSFGLILYEMASGKRAFERPEPVQIMSAILTDDAPPLDAKLPAPLRWIIERCLAKEPRDRYESSRDLFQELRQLRDRLPETTLASAAGIAPIAPPRRKANWQVAAAFAAGVALTGAMVSWRGHAGGPASEQSDYRFTPFSFESGGQCCVAWAPDGKSVAYSADAGTGHFQVFLRHLDAAVPVQLTHDEKGNFVYVWSADGKHIIFGNNADSRQFYSVSSVGGEPEPAFTLPERPANARAISPGARVLAQLRTGDDGSYGIYLSSPPGAPYRRYKPDPFASRGAYNVPQMRFSPDGKQILLFLNGEDRHEAAWLMPYPPDPSNPPRRVMKTMKPVGTSSFDWMPDNRHIVLGLNTGGNPQLWMADTRSEDRYRLTGGTQAQHVPSISPDGSKIIFVEGTSTADVVSLDLATAAVSPYLATDRAEEMPAWAAHLPVLAYVTNRNGALEIWLRNGESERPLISPASAAAWLMGPAPSPDGARVIYSVVDAELGVDQLWMTATAGGAPVRVTNDTVASEMPGSWSPDGAWFVYRAFRNGKELLMKVKSSGEAAPTVLKADVHRSNMSVPVWSPSGEWVAYSDLGDKLISPDGASVRDLGRHGAIASAFSADGKRLYGIRSRDYRAQLYYVDIATGAEKIVGDAGKGNEPNSPLNPALRLSLSPDGKSFTYGIMSGKDNLWMLQGFSK